MRERSFLEGHISAYRQEGQRAHHMLVLVPCWPKAPITVYTLEIGGRASAIGFLALVV